MFVYFEFREDSSQWVKDYYASEAYKKAVIHWKKL